MTRGFFPILAGARRNSTSAQRRPEVLVGSLLAERSWPEECGVFRTFFVRHEVPHMTTILPPLIFPPFYHGSYPCDFLYILFPGEIRLTRYHGPR